MITIIKHGKSPKTNVSATDEQLLLAAWAYGLKAGDKIHRFSLYTFVQSHLANKTEEYLQKNLETDIQNWKGEGKGFYKITEQGFAQLAKYGIPNLTISLSSVFTFSRNLGNDIISITVDPNTRKYIAKQNGVITNTEFIVQTIERLTDDRISKKQTSLPRKILNWILKDKNYQWKIE